MVKRTLLLLFMLLVASTVLVSAESDRELAQRILAHWSSVGAQRPTYFEETVVQFDGQSSHLVKKRLWRDGEDKFRLEITLEEGRTMTTIADGKDRWVIDSTAQVVLREEIKRSSRFRQAPMSPEGNVSLGEDSYFERPVYVITVEREGVVHRLWIDQETYILWKEERYHSGRGSVYVAYKTKVDWSPIIDNGLFTYTVEPGVTVVSDRRHWLERRMPGDSLRQSGFRLRYPVTLPSGFSLFHAEVVRPEGIPVAILQFRRNGELLSIFQQRGRLSEKALELLKARLRGAGGKEANLAYMVEGDVSYVAIGQLDVSQLEEILKSLR